MSACAQPADSTYERVYIVWIIRYRESDRVDDDLLRIAPYESDLAHLRNDRLAEYQAHRLRWRLQHTFRPRHGTQKCCVKERTPSVRNDGRQSQAQRDRRRSARAAARNASSAQYVQRNPA
jgi:hypothetical protein